MLIILGHLDTTKLLHDFVFMFHVPAFFFVAGITFHMKEGEQFVDFLKKKAYRLLLPYILFTIIISATQVATNLYVVKPGSISYTFSFRNIFLAILDILVCGSIEGTVITIGPAWFLYVLFVSSMLLYVCDRIKISNITKFCGVIVLYYFSAKTGWLNNLPCKLGQSIAALFFMCCGQLFESKLTKMSNLKPFASLMLAFVGMLMVLSIAWYLDDTIDMAGNHFPSSLLLATIVALVGCMSLYLLSSSIKHWKINKSIAFYGINSMLILGLHIPIRNIFRLALSRMGLSSQQSTLPIFIMIMVVSLPLIMVVNKYVPFLVGMKKQKNTLQ